MSEGSCISSTPLKSCHAMCHVGCSCDTQQVCHMWQAACVLFAGCQQTTACILNMKHLVANAGVHWLCAVERLLRVCANPCARVSLQVSQCDAKDLPFLTCGVCGYERRKPARKNLHWCRRGELSNEKAMLAILRVGIAVCIAVCIAVSPAVRILLVPCMATSFGFLTHHMQF